jgi:hypothetical protein
MRLGEKIGACLYMPPMIIFLVFLSMAGIDAFFSSLYGSNYRHADSGRIWSWIHEPQFWPVVGILSGIALLVSLPIVLLTHYRRAKDGPAENVVNGDLEDD